VKRSAAFFRFSLEEEKSMPSISIPARRLGIAAMVVVAALAASAPGAGEPLVLKLDTKASRVRFSIDALAHTVHGSFAVSGGELRFDPDTGAASGEVVVDSRSGETGNGSRDKKMHEVVLESARFPQIVFTASRIAGKFEREGASDLQLGGAIAIHGASHPVVLRVHAESRGGALTATAPLTVPFVEWGLEDPSNLLLRIAKQVEVEIEARGALAAPPQ
jgi:polyisoprenoid-binding protein YceI